MAGLENYYRRGGTDPDQLALAAALAAMRPQASHPQPAPFDIPNLPPLAGPPDSMHHQSEARATAKELMQLRQPGIGPMPSHEANRPMPDLAPPPPDPTAPATGGTQPTLADQPDIFWTEGGTGEPVTSFSKVFNQSATFQPGTTIYGRGTRDPLKEAEWRAMQAAIDDYSRKRMAVESAAALPEGRMRAMWADDPEQAAQMQARSQSALAQGLAALGPQPSRALPSEVTRSAERATAQGQMEAQPYANARELAALIGLAERVGSPQYRDVEMGKARIAAEAGLQQPVLDEGAIKTARAVDVAAAGRSLFGDSTTPAQAGSMMSDQAPGEPGATERPPAYGPGQRPGTGRVIREANLLRYAQTYQISPQQARQRVESLGYRVVP